MRLPWVPATNGLPLALAFKVFSVGGRACQIIQHSSMGKSHHDHGFLDLLSDQAQDSLISKSTFLSVVPQGRLHPAQRSVSWIYAS